MAKEIAWSHSALALFETCPKKYYHTKIKKDYLDKVSAVGDYGLESHKHFERRLLKKVDLPLDLQHHEPVLAKIAKAPGTGMPEQKLALNRDFQPTGFFDGDVWLRAIIDYAKVNDAAGTCLVVDHKFGKMKSGFDQVELCAAVMSCFKPKLHKFIAAYYWAKDKKLTSTVLYRDNIMEVWDAFIPRVDKLQRAVRNDEFPAKPNGLCRKYCAVKSCPHNGV